MSGARKPKPLKLKESVESAKADFDVKEFLGKGPQLKAMVPSSAPLGASDTNDQTAVIDPYAPKSQHSQNLHLVETQNGTAEFSKTLPLPGSGVLNRPSAMFNAPGASYEPTLTNVVGGEPQPAKSKTKSSVKWIDPNSTPAPKPKAKPVEKASSSKMPLILIVGALGLIGYIALAPTSKTPNATKKMSDADLSERVEFHRKTTGWRLNNERIEAQIENHFQAPSLPAGAQKVKPADMMAGLPLQGEATGMEGLRDKKSLPVNPTYADAKIMYGLQEEQDRIETEARAQKLYLQEFVDNAAADGYDVTVDKDGNITKVKKLKQKENPYGD